VARGRPEATARDLRAIWWRTARRRADGCWSSGWCANYAAWENHQGSNGIVHRKGAVRARAGEMVLIPGSMGTASYVGEGLGNPESFSTCQHGAGRAMSRSAARQAKTSAEVIAEMRTLGIALHSGHPKTVAEEAAFAYKDIEAVMAASASLVRPTKRLTPLGVVKGW